MVLVFPADLEKVEEIGCGGMDGDEILVGLRYRIGKIADFKLLRALYTVNLSSLKWDELLRG